MNDCGKAELYAGISWICAAERPDQHLQPFGEVKQGRSAGQCNLGRVRHHAAFDLCVGALEWPGQMMNFALYDPRA